MDGAHKRGFKEKLHRYEKCLAASDFYSTSILLLQSVEFSRIRCLALGSPTSEFQALYQLAYLNLICEKFKIKPEMVSMYDPAFSADDIEVLTTELNYRIETQKEFPSDSKTAKATLYYMPHAPRSLTEEILKSHEPRWLLANDFSVTKGTLTKAIFLEKYPNLARLVHLSEKKEDKPIEKNDGFVPVVSRKKRNRPRKNVYVEPKLDYDDENSRFEALSITRFHGGTDAEWKDSFSDLALNEVSLKTVNQ